MSAKFHVNILSAYQPKKTLVITGGMAKTLTQLQLLICLAAIWNTVTVSVDIVVSSVGKTVPFNCKNDLNSNMEWHHFGVGQQPVLVYKNGYINTEYKSRYSANCGTGYCNLTINSIAMYDAGRFECMESDDEKLLKEVELNVFNQCCNVSTNCALENITEQSCEMEFRGKIPSMKCIDRDGSEVTSTVKTIDGITTYTIRPMAYQKNISYSCKLQYEMESRCNWTYSNVLCGITSDSSTAVYYHNHSYSETDQLKKNSDDGLDSSSGNLKYLWFLVIPLVLVLVLGIWYRRQLLRCYSSLKHSTPKETIPLSDEAV